MRPRFASLVREHYYRLGPTDNQDLDIPISAVFSIKAISNGRVNTSTRRKAFGSYCWREIFPVSIPRPVLAAKVWPLYRVCSRRSPQLPGGLPRQIAAIPARSLHTSREWGLRRGFHETSQTVVAYLVPMTAH